MHLICESRLYTESSVYFAHNPLVKCSLFISQSDYKQKCIFVLRGLTGFWKAALYPLLCIISYKFPIIMTNEPQIQQIYCLQPPPLL